MKGVSTRARDVGRHRVGALVRCLDTPQTHAAQASMSEMVTVIHDGICIAAVFHKYGMSRSANWDALGKLTVSGQYHAYCR